MKQEEYYQRLNARLNEELGVNFAAYASNPKAHRKARLYQKQLETRPDMSWSGDSTVEAPDLAPPSAERSADPEGFVKAQVIDLMTKAQEKGIEMTHGEAHKIATDMLRKKVNQK